MLRRLRKFLRFGASPGLSFRERAVAEDVEHIRRITASSGLFSSLEVNIAVNMVKDLLPRGDGNDHRLLIAETGSEVVGYACFGSAGFSGPEYELYWIAVDGRRRGLGIGRHLLAETENVIRRLGGRTLRVEITSRDEYRRSRAFYERCGFAVAAVRRDFYCDGENKLTYSKELA